MPTTLLSTAYFPPIQYISKIKNSDNTIIEQWENFGKQSYRNRCIILTANGTMPLVVPVEKANSKTLIKDLKITYATNWQKNHFKSIESAYKNSPYYDYYIDELMPFFEDKELFLFDYNTKILNTILDIINIRKNINFSKDFIRLDDTINIDNVDSVNSVDSVDSVDNTNYKEHTYVANSIYLDFRNTIHPKASKNIEDKDFIVKPYHQVFCNRFEFQENLSILDLLFCCGPDTTCFL